MPGNEHGSTRPSPDTGKFRELDRLRSADGVIGIISQRVTTGVITFAIVREFPSHADGKIMTTSYIPEHLVQSCIDMVGNVGRRIAELRKSEPKAKTSARG